MSTGFSKKFRSNSEGSHGNEVSSPTDQKYGRVEASAGANVASERSRPSPHSERYATLFFLNWVQTMSP